MVLALVLVLVLLILILFLNHKILKYEKERIENAINKQYIINLEKALEINHIEKPSKPSSIKDITDNIIKDSISDIMNKEESGSGSSGSGSSGSGSSGSGSGSGTGSSSGSTNTYPIPQP